MIQPSSESENAPIRSVEAVPFTSHTPSTSSPITRYTINAVMTRPESFVVIPPASKTPAWALPGGLPAAALLLPAHLGHGETEGGGGQ